MKKSALFSLNRFPLFLLLSAILITSCQKDLSSEQTDPPTVNNPNAGKSYTTTAFIQGKILDEAGLPLAGVKVSAGSKSATTTVNGYFKISQASVDQKFAFVNAEKTGYYKGTRTFVSAKKDSNYVEIRLIGRKSQGTFNTSDGGTITVENSGTVAFPKNAIAVASTKLPYTGKVKVFTHRLDPTDPNFSDKMPGDLRGIREDGSESAMISYGMMAVELESETGEKLQLAAGSKATISLPIPSSLIATAPASIPLWWFDETKGLWIEEKAAQKSGNNYIGEVSHFTFWNCDVPAKFVYFKARILTQNNDPLSYTNVKIKSADAGTGYGYTNSEGFVAGWVPKNASLSLSVMNACGESIFSKDISTATDSIDLGDIVVTSPQHVVSLKGSVVNCDNQPIVNGMVYVYLDSVLYRANIANGQYNILVTKCIDAAWQANVWAVDYAAQVESDKAQVTVQSGVNSLPVITVCNTPLTEFLQIEYNGKTYGYTNVDYQKNSNDTLLSFAYSDSSSLSRPTFSFRVDLNSYANNICNAYPTYLIVDGQSASFGNGSTRSDCVFTKWGTNKGDLLEGSFSNTVYNTTPTKQVKFSFRVKR
ncbi:carboxypeptidase-like regulatory domain-containing protein [Chitinophagaceae bacterium 26-R-25]|nr:carboxypeptidase-like regulatory domain-containing protein [Chitinophagaceae bacterium 26-R-25]